MVGLEVGGDLGLCHVSIGEQLLLVVQQLFASLGRVLCVLGWVESASDPVGDDRRAVKLTLDNGIDGASFLAETTVDALCHVEVWEVSFCRRRRVSSDLPYFVVLLDPSSRASDSIVMAWAGQMASQSLHAGVCEQFLIIQPCGVLVDWTGLTDTSLLSVGVPPEGVLASESG